MNTSIKTIGREDLTQIQSPDSGKEQFTFPIDMVATMDQKHYSKRRKLLNTLTSFVYKVTHSYKIVIRVHVHKSHATSNCIRSNNDYASEIL